MKQHVDLNGKTILVTGSPGFVGANLVLRLLKELSAGTVISFDNMNDYYDPALKTYRLSLIEKAAQTASAGHVFIKGSIADKDLTDRVFAAYRPAVTVPQLQPSRSILSSPLSNTILSTAALMSSAA